MNFLIKNKLIFVILVLGLTACGKQTVVKREIVKVPEVIIKECQAPATVIDITDLPLWQITEDSTDEETARAYAESVTILKSKKDEYKEALKPFVKHEEIE